MSTEAQETPSARRRPSYLIPAAIVVGCVLVQLGLWRWLEGDSSKQVFSSYVMFPLVPFLLLIWWLFFSRVKMKLRLGVTAAAAMAAVLFFSIFKLEGYSGDFIPKFSLRWKSAPEADASHLKIVSPESGAKDAPIERLEVTPADWPQFGGPARDSIARGEKVRTDWKENPPKALWKHPIGLGWSSFAIVDRFAFTQEQVGPNEFVVCYNAETGEPVWTHSDPTRFVSVMGGDGPRATPTIHDSRIYSLGATGVLNCLDARSGKLFWTKNILEDAKVDVPQWGATGSPLLFGNLCVVSPGGMTGSALVAYDRMTGERVWNGGSHGPGFASPVLTKIQGLRQILMFYADGVAGHDAATGKELWHFAWSNVNENN
ncbi:MAG: PQQ-binding-like beta-propeller repeat protein, partial [Planctomycetaceae bacterium]